MPRFAAASSHHPVAADAVAEVVGAVIERLGSGPDLAVLTVAGPHAHLAAATAQVVEALLDPAHLLGATTAAPSASVSLWAGRLEAEVTPLALRSGRPRERALVVAAVADLASAEPVGDHGDQVVGVVAGGFEPLVLDRSGPRRRGAVGVVIEPAPLVVHAPPFRPFGPVVVAGRTRGTRVGDLGSDRALVHLGARIDALDETDRARARAGVFVAVRHRDALVAIRRIEGGDRATGDVVLDAPIADGDTVQVGGLDHDATSAAILDAVVGQRAAGALVVGAPVRPELDPLEALSAGRDATAEGLGLHHVDAGILAGAAALAPWPWRGSRPSAEVVVFA